MIVVWVVVESDSGKAGGRSMPAERVGWKLTPVWVEW